MTLTATLENAVVASCRWHQCLISRCCTICRSSTRALQQHNALAGTQQPSCHRSLSGPVTKLLLRQKHSFAYKTQAWTADHQHSTANDTGMEHSMPGMLQQRQNNSTLERYHAWCLSLTSITCRTFELIAMFSLDCWSPAFHGRWYGWRKHGMPGEAKQLHMREASCLIPEPNTNSHAEGLSWLWCQAWSRPLELARMLACIAPK